MFLVLIVLLAGITGLVFAVVKAAQQTDVTAGNPVMTIKGTSTPVQVASSDFYVDPITGYLRLRNPDTGGSAVGSRRLLDAQSPLIARTASADFNVNPSGLMLSNVMTEQYLISSLPSRDVASNASYSVGRHLLQTNTTVTTTTTTDPLFSAAPLPATPAPATILQPICEWASTDLFNPNTCLVRSVTGPTSKTVNTVITVPYWGSCLTMTGACTNFKYITIATVPFFGQGMTPTVGSVLKSLEGRLYVPSGVCLGLCCVASLTLRSHSGRRLASPSRRWPTGKTPRPFLPHPA